MTTQQQMTEEQETIARQMVLRSYLFRVFSAVQDVKRYADPVLDHLSDCENSISRAGVCTVGSRRRESMLWRLTEMKKFIEKAIDELNNA